MANTLEWLFNIKGNVQAQLNSAASAFMKTDSLAKQFQKTTNALPNSLEGIRKKIDDLKVIRELTTDVKELAKANREIQSLEKQSNKLSGLGTQNKVQSFLQNGALSQIPGVAGLAGIATPAGAAAAGVALVGAALVDGTKKAFAFEAGMAKANTTLGLSKGELEVVSKEVKSLAATSGLENAIGQVPDAFNQIVSGVGDTKTSLDILRNSLKGAEAAQTDLNVVSDATVNVLNAVGKSNTNAKEVLDTLFGAVNVGKGEFADFANYLPKIIPLSNNLGLSFKETAGAFAYYTSQGLKAEAASTTLENVFKALSDSKRQKEFKKLGIELFDNQGKLKSLVDISTQLKTRFDGLTAKQRIRILDSLGLDQEATLGLSSFIQDVDKLKDSISRTSNAAQEGIGLDAAAKNGANAQAEYNRLMNQFTDILTELGLKILPIVNNVLGHLNNMLIFIKGSFGAIGKLNDKIGETVNGNKALQAVANPVGFIAGLFGKKDNPTTPVENRPTKAINRVAALPGALAKPKVDPFAKKRLEELDKKDQDTVNKVTGGGSRPVNINIRFESLNKGGITIQSTTVQEGAAQIEAILSEYLLRVVNSANQVALG
ncbi:phage tail tape measure protein [Cytophagaceae bacterium DM2B3-1]|uniref:Phage tail tape measure protein n=1 Tax=Xanthocytophaga flava TaxID=3048013 RepID=A0ABT7CKD4_9BACT|nr:phage tail tape measure protein [Xanthocytophaga flavus]MDJ1494155.1 phage tail tape measure protein [Xanthocytophaga flavus]